MTNPFFKGLKLLIDVQETEVLLCAHDIHLIFIYGHPSHIHNAKLSSPRSTPVAYRRLRSVVVGYDRITSVIIDTEHFFTSPKVIKQQKTVVL